jgi:uncharacterized protein YkwD
LPAVVLALACASQPGAGAVPAFEEGSAEPPVPERAPRPPRRPGIVFRPAVAASPAYLSPPLRPPPPPRVREKARTFELALVDLIAEAARRADVPTPIPDERLSRLAADVARMARQTPTLPSEVLRFLTSHHGIVEADPVVYTLRGPANEQTALERYQRSVPSMLGRTPWNRLGVGVSREASDMVGVVAMWEQLIELRPLPREVASGARLRLRGRMLRPYQTAQVVVTMPSGDVRRLPFVLQDGVFEADLRCNYGDGRYQVEMLASDAGGPRVLANFPVFCGVQAPEEIVAQEEVVEAIDPGDGEQELFALMNHDRRAAGLAPLVWDNRLAAIARQHSREMATRRYVAHVSPTTGDAEARVRAVGLGFSLVSENVGLEGGIEPAHKGFMNSPGHRANVLSPKLTHVGVGIVPSGRSGASNLYITELFGGQK